MVSPFLEQSHGTGQSGFLALLFLLGEGAWIYPDLSKEEKRSTQDTTTPKVHRKYTIDTWDSKRKRRLGENRARAGREEGEWEGQEARSPREEPGPREQKRGQPRERNSQNG